MADAIAAHIKYLQNKQQPGRMRQQIANARLYGNNSLLGISGFSSSAMLAGTTSGTPRERITDNVIKSVIDTATAKVGENKPRPYYLTSGGTYKQQRKAKQLNRITEGIFYECQSYELGGAAQRDAEIFGDGLVHVFEKHGRVCQERVLGAELWVDEVEAAYGRPRQLHRTKAVDRWELVALCPDKKDVILKADAAPIKDNGGPNNVADLVLVRESWHLPSGPKSKDGKHCISIDGHLLTKLEDWPHPVFPFARWVWSPKPLGFWSQGLAEELQGKQFEVNKILAMIQRSFHLASTYKVLMEMGSKIVKEHVNNEIGAILEYRGIKPEWFVPQVVPPEYYVHLERIVTSMYERAGISLQSATGVKPAGLNSGAAQREYRDTVQERLKTQERYNERGYMELSRLSLMVARDIAEREGHFEAKAPKGRMLEAISMTAEELDPDEWDLQCFPTSSLPKDPAGRLATIQEYIQAGFMTPRQGRRALDFPDLEAVESLANAAEDLITKMLDAICDEGDYESPEPTDDLKLAKELAVEYINRGRALGLEEDRMDMLRTWNVQVDAIIAQATPPPAPAPAMGPGMGAPQAAPMPPPQSNLIPNAPMAA